MTDWIVTTEKIEDDNDECMEMKRAKMQRYKSELERVRLKAVLTA